MSEGEGMVFAHRDAERKEVKLDDRSGPLGSLMGTVGGAAKASVQNWSEITSQSLPKCCITVESAVVCLGCLGPDSPGHSRDLTMMSGLTALQNLGCDLR